MAESVEVRVRDCACPGTPHEDGDVVYLLPSLSLEGGAAAEMDRELVMEGFSEATPADQTKLTLRLLARWTDTFVRYGAVGWNWLTEDDKGRPVPRPFNIDTLLSDWRLARLVAKGANELYAEAILGPLLEAAALAQKAAAPNRAQRRSATGRTGSSTSRKRGSISKLPESSSEPPSDGPPLRIAR